MRGRLCEAKIKIRVTTETTESTCMKCSEPKKTRMESPAEYAERISKEMTKFKLRILESN